MLSLTFMTVPILLETTDSPAQLFHQWARMYHHGHQVLPGTALATTALYVSLAARSQRGWGGVYAAAAVATVAMLPFTWVFMVPTNNRLFELDAGKGHKEAVTVSIGYARELVAYWARLHLFRCGFPLVGVLLGAWGDV